MQQAKIENSGRDESRVDTKKWWGGGGGGVSHTRDKIPQKMPTGPEQTSSINKHFDVPLMPINRNNYPWLSFNDLEDIYTAECFKYIDY